MQLPHLHPYQGQHCAPPPPRPKLPAWTLGLYPPFCWSIWRLSCTWLPGTP